MDLNLSRAANAYQQHAKMMEGLEASPFADEELQKPSFSDMLGNAFESATNTVAKAEKMQVQSMTGDVELADLVTAIAEAELTVNTIVAVRDRVIAAYQEISRMPI